MISMPTKPTRQRRMRANDRLIVRLQRRSPKGKAEHVRCETFPAAVFDRVMDFMDQLVDERELRSADPDAQPTTSGSPSIPGNQPASQSPPDDCSSSSAPTRQRRGATPTSARTA